jgi:hypothetical protein
MENAPFHACRADGSNVWEVWQRGSNQRLGSSMSAYAASDLATTLNRACAEWAARLINTIDA